MATESAECKKFWRKQIKKRAMQAFGNKCLICGNSYPDSVYDFHHINSVEKDFAISSNKISSKSGWYDIRDELQKCIMVCSNCHRIIHNEENNFIIEEKNYFDTNYYDWEDIDYIIDHQTLERICKSKKETQYCLRCGKLREYTCKSGLCKKCSYKNQQVVERPPREEFKNLIRNITFTDIGKQFGVSGNAIKKWCDAYDLPRTKKEIKTYSNLEWENI